MLRDYRMADIKSSEERSRNMSAIKRTGTKPELYIRRLLFHAGYRYRLQTNKIPGHPDLWLGKFNTAVFVHGCFWHRHKGCSLAYTPKSRGDFWNKKFENNVKRDRVVHEQLRSQNIRCLIIWECRIRQAQKKNVDPSLLLKEIEDFLFSDRDYQEL